MYLVFISSSSLCRRSSFSSSSDSSEGFWNKKIKEHLIKIDFLSCFSVRKVWGQGTTSNPKGCFITMWWRQSGQVNPVLFCPLYFLLVHINTSPCGGATCYKSTVHFCFLNLLPTQTPNVLKVIFLLVSREPFGTKYKINVNKAVSQTESDFLLSYLFTWQPILLQQILFQVT